MKIARLDYDPISALEFYQESLSVLGAISERTWHDRLDVVAEGRAAKVWNEHGGLHHQELFFASADAVGARDAYREVFPGCPLTFRLFEALRPAPLALEKAVLSFTLRDSPPDRAVLEKLWRTQYPSTRKWRLTAVAQPAFHFSLVAVVRCEIQAIDQHWSLHRIAIGLPGGEPDDLRAREIALVEIAVEAEDEVEGPRSEASRWWPLLRKQIECEMLPDIEAVRSRQQQYLQREIQRLDDYFALYEQELSQRTSRAKATATAKATERLAAAHAEHARRRMDQVTRHEICVQPHVDALLLTAEPCWQASLEVEEQRAAQIVCATFVPRARRWFRGPA